MILCFNCSSDTKQMIDSLISKGQYKDYSEVVSVAVANLLVLGRELNDKDILVIEGDKKGKGRPYFSAPDITPAFTDAVRKTHTGTSRKMHQATPLPMEQKSYVVPSLFLHSGFGDPPASFAQRPDEEITLGQEVSLDRWLFGQFNKLLPAKVNCRALAHLISDFPSGIPMEVATCKISDAAAELGEYLTQYDFMHQIDRDNAFATAFPRIDVDREKGLNRYGNQFVGSVSSRGKLSGLLYEYKLANLSSNNRSCIQLTRAGWDFALLPNPVLEGNKDFAISKFSHEETDWLLNHIQQTVSVEAFAIRAILTAIREGANTPEKIDATLAPLIPRDSGRSLSPSFLASQRSGAISRMVDLGTIIRIRTGTRVSYSVTEIGEKFYNIS